MENEGLNAFCGTVFWDPDLTWNTEDPDFTPCFQQTVLVWIPCVFLWAFAPLETFYLLHSKTRNIPWSFLNISKLVVTSLLVILVAIDLGYAVRQSNNDFLVYPVDYYTPIIKGLTFLLSAVLLLYNKIRGIRTSGTLFLFWLLMLLCATVQYRTELRQAIDTSGVEKIYPFVSFMIYWPLLLAIFLLNCFADSAPSFSEFPPKENPCPEQSASFLSKIVFAWFDKLAWKGFRSPLVNEDLWSMNPEDTAEEVVPIFEKYWKKSQRQSANVSNTKASFRKTSGSVDFSTGKTKPKHQPSIMPAICKAFGPTFLFGSLLKLINDLMTFVSPQILKLLIAFVDGKESLWKGYFYSD